MNASGIQNSDDPPTQTPALDENNTSSHATHLQLPSILFGQISQQQLNEAFNTVQAAPIFRQTLTSHPAPVQTTTTDPANAFLNTIFSQDFACPLQVSNCPGFKCKQTSADHATHKKAIKTHIDSHLNGDGINFLSVISKRALEIYLQDNNRYLCVQCPRMMSNRFKKCNGCSTERSVCSAQQIDFLNVDELVPPTQIYEAVEAPREATDYVSLIRSSLKQYHHSYRFIPKNVRPQFFSVLQQLFQNVAEDSENLEKWAQLLLFPRTILFKPKSITTSVSVYLKTRLKNWADNWEELHLSMFVDLPVVSAAATVIPREAQSSINIKRCVRLCQQNRTGDALKALLSNGISNAENLLPQLLNKHPQLDTPEISPAGACPRALQITPKDVEAALKSFKHGSAGGPSQYSSDLLKGIFNLSDEELRVRFLDSLTAVVNVLLAGDASRLIAPFISSANLIPLSKKDGGIRPIAVGEVLRRIVSKCAFSAVKTKAVNIFGSLQLGIGVPNGCEAIIHFVKTFFGEHRENQVLLKIDFVNAFNNVKRSQIFEKTRALFPEISAWAEYSYGQFSDLLFKEILILSCQGVQQGDPLGPLLFSAVLHDLVVELSAKFPTTSLNVWYLDDGTIICDVQQVTEIVEFIELQGLGKGLILSREKTEVWGPGLFTEFSDSLPPWIYKNTSDGCKLLGAPIGGSDFEVDFLKLQIGKIQEIISNLVLLENPHCHLQLLRGCVFFPKVAHLLRVCDPEKARATLEAYDLSLYNSLRDIANQPVTLKAFNQATLPSDMGGLGIYLAATHSPAAYLASVAQTITLQKQIRDEHSLAVNDLQIPSVVAVNQLSAFSAKFPELDLSFDILSTKSHPQNFLSQQLNEGACLVFSANLTTDDKVRLNSLKLPLSTAWLSQPPRNFDKNAMSAQQFSTTISRFLGLNVFNHVVRCSMCNHAMLDPLGHHALMCSSHGGRTHRHDSTCVALFQYLKRHNVAVQRERRHIFDNSGEKPADLYFPVFEEGRPMAVDFSNTHPHQAALASRIVTAGSEEFAITRRENDKVRHYGARCAELAVDFLPLVMDTYGALSQRGLQFLTRLASQIARDKQAEWQFIRREMIQILQVSVLKLSANMIHVRR